MEGHRQAMVGAGPRGVERWTVGGVAPHSGRERGHTALLMCPPAAPGGKEVAQTCGSAADVSTAGHTRLWIQLAAAEVLAAVGAGAGVGPGGLPVVLSRRG